MYRSIKQEVPIDYYSIPFCKASMLKEGHTICVITYGTGVHWALEVLEKLTDISVQLVDLRTLQPLDTETIFESVKNTGKVIILQEDSLFGGIAGDISALINENCFEYLDAPVVRVGSLETPIPFNSDLEQQYLAKSRFEDALIKLNDY